MNGNSQRVRRVNTIAAGGQYSAEQPRESTELETAIQTFLRRCRVRNLSGETMRYYTGVFNEIRRVFDGSRPIDITQEDIDAYIESRLHSGIEASTLNMYLRGWAAFFNFLREEGFIPESLRIRQMKYEKKIIETFSKAQIKALLDAPDRATFTGYRDYVIMVMFLDTGIRLEESAKLRIADINWDDRLLRIKGKGRKERLVPFQLTVLRHLKEYVAIRGLLDHDYLFVNIDNSPMKKRTVQDNIRKIGLAANIKGVRVSPHTFRHTFAKIYIVNGGDPFSLQKILGHTTMEMVRRYVNLFSTDVAKQHRKFSPMDRLDDWDD